MQWACYKSQPAIILYINSLVRKRISWVFLKTVICPAHGSTGILYPKVTHGTRKNPIVLWPSRPRSKGQWVQNSYFPLYAMKNYLESCALDSNNLFSEWRYLISMLKPNDWIHPEVCREAAAAPWNPILLKFNRQYCERFALHPNHSYLKWRGLASIFKFNAWMCPETCRETAAAPWNLPLTKSTHDFK